MLFERDTLDNFSTATGFDVETFINDFISFMETGRQRIIDYYGGVTQTPDIEAFSTLETLLSQSDSIGSLIYMNKESFTSFADWNLLDELEDINSSLKTVSNSSKYLRSSITKNNFNPNPEIDVTLRQKQTIERLSSDTLGSRESQNDWINIALRNDLREEDYSTEGGNLLKVTLQNGNSFFISAVVDNIVGEKCYGLDLDKKFTFVNNDLKVLSYKNTIIQTVKILAQLRRNDNPEFPGDGIQSNLVVGSNLGALTYPSLFRQLYNTFSKDDTLKSFAIKNISQDQDSVLIEYQVETRLGEVLSQTIAY